MVIFIAIIASLLVGAVGFMAGALFSSLTGSRGPASTRKWACVPVAAGMVGIILLAAHHDEKWLGFAAASIFGFAFAFAVRYFVRRLAPGIDYQLDMPVAVRDLGLAKFEMLDADGDGIIRRADLRVPSGRASEWQDHELEILKHMWDHFDDIGHWVDAVEQEKMASELMHMRLGVPRKTFKVVSGVYAISREDLKTYPRRAAREEREAARRRRSRLKAA